MADATTQSAANQAASTQTLPGPLDGVRVLDFTNMMAGPYCTRLMADLGAEVIKVEPPTGDHNRGRDPLREGWSAYFGHLNAGKRYVVLDLKSPEGLDAARGLASQSQVLVENWRPGVAPRLGLGYEDMAKVSPGLVYCSISGYGQQGPGADRPAYAPMVHAISGFDVAQIGYRGEGDRPAPTGTYIADVLAGMSAFGGIQAALYQRKCTGRGQYIDVALLDGMYNLLVPELQEVQFPGHKMRIYTPVRTSDGYVVVAPTSQNNFEDMADLIGHPEWKADARFRVVKDRERNWQELMNLIEEWTSQRSMDECEEKFLGANVPCSRYCSLGESIRDPHVAARGSFSEVTDGAGKYLVPNPPFQMPGVNARVRPRIAALGADTEAVLGSLLGYSAERVLACAGKARRKGQ